MGELSICRNGSLPHHLTIRSLVAAVYGEQTTMDTSATIQLLHTAEHMQGVVDVFQQVWGTSTEIVRLEMLMAIAHAGGYVAAAVDEQGTVLGASVGILAVHGGAPALHSHITGVLPGVRQTGLGRRLKLHQQSWARERSIDWIVWTYDPLVRRNAWFNIAVLGAEVHEYLDSFYGVMTDALNAGDESDRLLVAWSVATDPDHELFDGSGIDDALLLPTPIDVVALRRTDPSEVARWRADSRAAWHAALAEGRRILGFTRDGEYVLGSAA
ncbi:MAG: GNAT family N-acetyltransferase [Acidimicrobiia bacterium]|nr:GNAT family N-acetyltransferase [Acidimicrobiia bacterium]